MAQDSDFLYAIKAIELILAAGAYVSAMRPAESPDEPRPKPSGGDQLIHPCADHPCDHCYLCDVVGICCQTVRNAASLAAPDRNTALRQAILAEAVSVVTLAHLIRIEALSVAQAPPLLLPAPPLALPSPAPAPFPLGERIRRGQTR
jgi:hypothetical protein